MAIGRLARPFAPPSPVSLRPWERHTIRAVPYYRTRANGQWTILSEVRDPPQEPRRAQGPGIAGGGCTWRFTGTTPSSTRSAGGRGKGVHWGGQVKPVLITRTNTRVHAAPGAPLRCRTKSALVAYPRCEPPLPSVGSLPAATLAPAPPWTRNRLGAPAADLFRFLNGVDPCGTFFTAA